MSDRFREDYDRALAAAPYGDDRLVERMTLELIAVGHSILQSHKLSDNNLLHVAALLGYFQPPENAHVLDIGSGVGAVANRMRLLSPDLTFTLLNISPAQLALSPAYLGRACGHMHALPFRDQSFDAAMFCFSLGHGLIDLSLAEATRVVRRHGVLFAFELTVDQPEDLTIKMGYRAHRVNEVTGVVLELGGGPVTVVEPGYTTRAAAALFGDAFTHHGFDRCWPVIYRWQKA